MDKHLRVIILDGDETVHDDEVKSVALLGDSVDEDRFVEIIMNETIMGMASKIAQSNKFIHAAKMARVIEDINRSSKDEAATEMEDVLNSIFEGGLEE